jgi:hypothetical protein
MNGREAYGRLVPDIVDTVGLELGRWCSTVNVADYDLDLLDVLFGFLGRQYQVWTAIVLGPSCWTVATASLLLRGLVDAHITLSWIIRNPDRAKRYKVYSAGRHKLLAEHERQYHGVDGKSERADALDELANSELWVGILPVELANWSGKDIRTMAMESDLKEMYDLAYSPLSSDAHAEWMTLRQRYLRPCAEVGHKSHWVPRFERPMLRSDVAPSATNIFLGSVLAITDALQGDMDNDFWQRVQVDMMKAWAAIHSKEDKAGSETDAVREPGNDDEMPEGE